MNFKTMITSALAVGILATGAAAQGNLVNGEANAESKKGPSLINTKPTFDLKRIQTAPYTVTVNGISAPIESSFKFIRGQQTTFYDLNKRVKDALKSDRGVTERQIKKAKSAKYTIKWKNNKKTVVNLKNNRVTANLFDEGLIKSIDINVKTK